MRCIDFEKIKHKTENGFTPDFEEAVLRASADEESVGPFSTAKKAISYLHKCSK